MTTLRVLLSRLRSLFGQSRHDARLSEEIETHLALLAEERMREGMSRAEARASARATFGGVEQVKETYGRDSNVIGRSVTIGTVLTIVGA